MTATGGHTSARRPRGRPRSARVDAAILDATLELLAEHGLEGLSIEAAAARAGVGKATIYRRWPSRDAMVAAAFRSVNASVRLPDTGDVRTDLVALLAEFQRVTLRSVPAAMMPRLMAAVLTRPELLRLFLANALAPRRAAVLDVLERARARGQLRPEADLDLAFGMIVGTVFQTALIGPTDAIGAPDLPARLVDALLDGIAAR
jgi:AcrR family transcriptional regulator